MFLFLVIGLLVGHISCQVEGRNCTDDSPCMATRYCEPGRNGTNRCAFIPCQVASDCRAPLLADKCIVSICNPNLEGGICQRASCAAINQTCISTVSGCTGSQPTPSPPTDVGGPQSCVVNANCSIQNQFCDAGTCKLINCTNASVCPTGQPYGVPCTYSVCTSNLCTVATCPTNLTANPFCFTGVCVTATPPPPPPTTAPSINAPPTTPPPTTPPPTTPPPTSLAPTIITPPPTTQRPTVTAAPIGTVSPPPTITTNPPTVAPPSRAPTVPAGSSGASIFIFVFVPIMFLLMICIYFIVSRIRRRSAASRLIV